VWRSHDGAQGLLNRGVEYDIFDFRCGSGSWPRSKSCSAACTGATQQAIIGAAARRAFWAADSCVLALDVAVRDAAPERAAAQQGAAGAKARYAAGAWSVGAQQARAAAELDAALEWGVAERVPYAPVRVERVAEEPGVEVQAVVSQDAEPAPVPGAWVSVPDAVVWVHFAPEPVDWFSAEAVRDVRRRPQARVAALEPEPVDGCRGRPGVGV